MKKILILIIAAFYLTIVEASAQNYTFVDSSVPVSTQSMADMNSSNPQITPHTHSYLINSQERFGGIELEEKSLKN